MKYFLRNIAQNSLVRTIAFVLIGLLVWICRLVTLDSLTAGLWTMALTLVNSLLITRYVSKVGWTNLPSAFVVSTVWMLLSVLSMWQLCWQVHLVVLMFTIVGVVLVRMNIQEEAREQAYGLALLCCILSPHYIASIAACLCVLAYLVVRSRITWRVMVAWLLGIATYVLYGAIVRYLGWCAPCWLEHLPMLPWQWWMIGLGSYLWVALMVYMPIVRASVFSGVLYIIGVLSALITSVWRMWQMFA